VQVEIDQGEAGIEGVNAPSYSSRPVLPMQRLVLSGDKGEKSMWPVQLFVFALAAGLAGCSDDARQSPKLDEIAVIVANMNQDDDAEFAKVKEDLATATQKRDADVQECHNGVESQCLPISNTSKWGFPFMSPKDTRKECVESTHEYFCTGKDINRDNLGVGFWAVTEHDIIVDDNKAISDIESKLAYGYRTSHLVMTLLRSDNYEGTVIAYVKIRTKGTDDYELDKVTFKREDNYWTYTSVAVNHVPE
jgi:hypothetical protein